MVDLKVSGTPENSRQVTQVSAEGSREKPRQQERREPPPHRSRTGAEELSVALAGDGRAAMEARYEEDADGSPLIRIIDVERGETVAVLTPEELRELTEQTGLPPGLLIRTST